MTDKHVITMIMALLAGCDQAATEADCMDWLQCYDACQWQGEGPERCNDMCPVPESAGAPPAAIVWSDLQGDANEQVWARRECASEGVP